MSQIDFYYNDLWSRVLKKLYETKQFGEDVIDLYIKGSKIINYDDKGIDIVASNFAGFSIMQDPNNSKIIKECLEEVLEQPVAEVRLLLEDNFSSKTQAVQNDFFDLRIEEEQRFDTFCIGKSNSQAHAAAITVANNLGSFYNPLFIYGNSGIGKSHLLNAIGNYVLNTFPNKQIGYISGTGFVEALSKALKENTVDAFKETFYNLDLLLVDDIQFISNKTKTQEVFFTIFNTLVNNRKQICITADCAPNEIHGIEERIISRFNKGLNVNIESPEFETRIAILKAKLSNIVSEKVDEEVFTYMATNFSKDVRELEGAINRLYFYYIQFKGNEDHISLNLAIEAFKDQIQDNRNELSVSKIKKIVADYYNLTTKQLTSSTRTKNIAIPRHIAMYLCRNILDVPYKEIGNEFGNRDHSTVINACEKVESLIKTDQNYSKAIDEIKARMN